MNYNQETGQFEEEKKKINVWKYVAIGAIVLVIVLVVTLFCVSDETLEKIGISPNLFNSGATAYGDVNEDGTVNAEDALIVLQYASGKKSLDDDKIKIADVDGNGEINQIDAQLILKKSTKLIVIFPVEEDAYGFAAGDVNFDGKINSSDAQLVLKYIESKTILTEYQQTLADVSGDGNVTQLDAELILNYSAKKISSFPIVDSKCKYYTLGDVNEDGVINSGDALVVQQYVNGTVTLTAIQQVAADVTEDGKITSEDAELILQVSVGKTEFDTNVNTNTTVNTDTSTDTSTNTTTDSSTTQTTPVEQALVYGDVDGDGSINSTDARLALQHSSGKITLTGMQFKCADVDGNGKVEAIDAELILKYSVKKIDKLDPSVTYYILGDVDADGVITSTDARLILQYSVSKIEFDEVQKKAADYNGDGKINAEDAQNVLAKASGK